MDKRKMFDSRFKVFDDLEYIVGDDGGKSKPVDVKSKYAQFLDLVYGVDPQTGLPSGDLAIYFNKDSNVEVKNFIESNLLLEQIPDESMKLSLPQNVVNSLRKNITDDDIAFLSRNVDETVEDYASRIHGFLLKQKHDNEMRKEFCRFKSRLEKFND